MTTEYMEAMHAQEGRGPESEVKLRQLVADLEGIMDSGPDSYKGVIALHYDEQIEAALRRVGPPYYTED